MEDLKYTFTKIYEEHSDALFRYCYFRVSDSEKATDIIQEVFTKTWVYTLAGNEIDNIKAFLYTTARHLIIDEYRKKKSLSLDFVFEQGFEIMNTTNVSPEITFDANLAVHEIHKLPETYRDILFMRYVNDMSVKDIASILDLSENVVSVRLHRGLACLRKNLKNI